MPLDATTFLSFSILAFLYCINHAKKTLRPEYTNIAPAYDKEMRCMTSIGCFRVHWNGEFVFHQVADAVANGRTLTLEVVRRLALRRGRVQRLASLGLHVASADVRIVSGITTLLLENGL